MDNENLQNQIDELKRRLDARDKQQITFPLDVQSINTLQKYFMRITDTIKTTGGAAAKIFFTYVGIQDERRFEVSENLFVPYTVDASTNIFTIVPGTRFKFVDGEAVYFATEDAVPSPLIAGTDYYVISASADGTSFKVSDSVGGPEINITDTGSGKQYIFYF